MMLGALPHHTIYKAHSSAAWPSTQGSYSLTCTPPPPAGLTFHDRHAQCLTHTSTNTPCDMLPAAAGADAPKNFKALPQAAVLQHQQPVPMRTHPTRPALNTPYTPSTHDHSPDTAHSISAHSALLRTARLFQLSTPQYKAVTSTWLTAPKPSLLPAG